MEAGDILETYFQIGNNIYGYEVVNPFDPTVGLAGSYNYGEVDCPICNGTNTCVIRYSTPYDVSFNWYCQECFLVWRVIKIGESTKVQEVD